MIGPLAGLSHLRRQPALPAVARQRAGMTPPPTVTRYAMLTPIQDIEHLSRLHGRNDVLIGPGGAPITEAGELEQYLSGFGGDRVADDAVAVDLIEPNPGGWRSSGHFGQHGTAPDKKPYAAKGSFVADWTCGRHNWRIVRMKTASGEA